jgi:hypothetical protein
VNCPDDTCDLLAGFYLPGGSRSQRSHHTGSRYPASAARSVEGRPVRYLQVRTGVARRTPQAVKRLLGQLRAGGLMAQKPSLIYYSEEAVRPARGASGSDWVLTVAA